MNNLRLLTVLVVAALSGKGACVVAAEPRLMTLDELFSYAESASAQLRPAFSAEDEARRAVDVARAERLPDINASLSLSYIGDGFTVKRNFSDYQRAPIPHFGNTVGINVSQPVYAGGAISRGIELAELRSTSARFETDLQRQNIRFNLAGLYLDLYKYTNLRRVVEANIANARSVLAEMQSRYEQGVVLKNDITRYELLLSDFELQLIKTDNMLAVLNSSLVSVAGLPDGTVVMPDTTILERSLPLAGEDWWTAETEANAPALQLARTGVSISRRAEDLTRAASKPKVSLQAGWTFDGPILVEVPPINRNLSYWYVGVGVSYNLSSLYKNNKAMAKSRAASLHAADVLEATSTNLRLGVHNDYIRYLEAYEELKTQQKSLELAELNYSTISTRYMAEMALLTDLVDAANSRFDAGVRLVNARINIIYQYYKLLFTSGKI